MEVGEIVIAALTVLICVSVAQGGAARIARRYRLAWTDPNALANPAEWSPLTTRACTALAVLQLLWSGGLLAQMVAMEGSAWRPAVVLALGGVATAAAMFFQATRRYTAVTAAVAAGHLAVGVAGVVLLASAGGVSTPVARIAALFLALASQVWFWAWIAGVWTQQLDRGVAWTTAGRLCLVAPHIALSLAIAALAVFGIAVFIVQREGVGCVSAWSAGGAGAGWLLLLAGLLRRWRHQKRGSFPGVN